MTTDAAPGAATRRLAKLTSAASRALLAWEAHYVDAALSCGGQPEFATLAAAMRDLRRHI